MREKITNLVKQMHKTEQKELLQHIEAQYGLKEKNGMLRDDISLKIRELLEMSHTWFVKVKEENTSPFFLSLLIYILLHYFYFITRYQHEALILFLTPAKLSLILLRYVSL